MQRRSFVLALSGLTARMRRADAADEVVVFAAASLTDALTEIAAAYGRRSGRHVVFSFGASSTLARQIRAGAPAEIFLSADLAQMDALEKAGLVRAADRVDLVSNHLVVIVPRGSSRPLRTVADLATLGRIALADPTAVPAGVYARQWLERRGLWSALQERVVPTLDVRAALAAVAAEAAEAGIVYRTDAAISSRVRVAFEVKEEDAPRIVYPAGLVARTAGPAARDFLHELRSPAARAVFERLGFLWLQGP